MAYCQTDVLEVNMPKLPKKCPSCASSLVITRLTCPACSTEVTGQFDPDFFGRLTSNDFDFVVLFIKSKGNIKEMERELGISYWTIRNRLNDIVEQLNAEAQEPSSPDVEDLSNRREKILEQLNSGLLSVEEATARLEELKRR
jgi:hypothetical protein